jgi:alpha-amylase
MEMGIEHAGRLFRDALGNQPGTVTINADGWGEFTTAGGSVSVWVSAE